MAIKFIRNPIDLGLFFVFLDLLLQLIGNYRIKFFLNSPWIPGISPVWGLLTNVIILFVLGFIAGKFFMKK